MTKLCHQKGKQRVVKIASNIPLRKYFYGVGLFSSRRYDTPHSTYLV